MEKVNLDSKSILKAIDIEYKKALEDDDFKKLVNSLKVPEKVLKTSVTLLNDTLLELKNCKKCKSLNECKNKVHGHVYFPENNEDARIDFVYTPCKYQKKFIEALEEKEKSKNEIDNARMKDIDITDKKRIDVIKWLKKFYDEYDRSKIMKGLYLHGSFGSGKTFLVASLLNELREKKHATTEIVYFPELLRSLRDDFNLLESKVYHLKRVDLLLLDDIGAENVTNWGRDEILGAILQYRMSEKMPTFFTSNLNIKELENHLSLTKNNEDQVKARRIVERIKQLSEPIELISENKRK